MASVQPRNDISLLESRTDEGICSGIFTVVLTLFSLILVICTFPFSLCVCVRMVQVHILSNALSFYRSQNILGWSKFFVTDQKFIYIFWQSQTFCARQKDDLHSVKLVFVPAQKFLMRH